MERKKQSVTVQHHTVQSVLLAREVKIDFYLPAFDVPAENLSLLLVNDGQDLVTMHFEKILGKLYDDEMISPMLCAGIHCSTDRKNEYGTA